MSSLFDYFQSLSSREGNSIDDSFICCIKCFSHGINKIFSKKNIKELKNHLMEFHAIVAENEENVANSPHQGDEKDKEEKPVISEVWKYFCKPTRRGVIVDNEHVYCGKCLESDKKTRYNTLTSTSSLKRHLLVAHNINIANNKEHDEPNVSLKGFLLEEGNDDGGKKKRAKRSSNFSAIRSHFSQHSDYSWCAICEKEGHAYKFSKNTSSMILKRHLIVFHKIDPHLKSTIKTDIPTDIPQDALELAQDIIDQEPLRPKKYFITMENDTDVIYCCFCLVKQRKQGYKPSTSETNLKLHLSKIHNYELFAENTEKRTRFDKNSQNAFVNPKILDTAKSVSASHGLKTREYFIQIPKEATGTIFCTFCLLKGFKQGYSLNTSTTNLLSHLKTKHQFDPRSNENTNEVDNSNEELKETQSESPLVTIKYCRSCGNQNTSFFSKFSSPFLNSEDNEESQKLTLGEIYTEITEIPVYPDDGMSQCICYPCEANLKTAYHFKKLSMKTENTMMKKFGIDQPEYLEDE